MCLEVQVLSGGATCAPSQSDDIARLHLLSYLDQVFRLVAVEGLQSVRMLDDDAVAVATVRTGTGDDPREGCKNLVVGFRLQVHTGMDVAAAAIAVRADDLGARQRIRPLIVGHLGEVPVVDVAIGERAFCHARRTAFLGFHLDAIASFLEHHHLSVQLVALRLHDAGWIDAPPVSSVNVRSLSLGDIVLWLILGIIVFGAAVSLLLYRKKGTDTPTADESDNEHIITLSEGKTLIEERIKADKMLDDADWQILYHEADDMIGGFRERLYSVFPLSTQEYRICLLIKYGVNNKGISTLLCRSTSAVSLARKRLHKKLFNEGGKAKDLDKYIRTL